MADDWNPEEDVSNELLERLPAEVLETFTPEQRAALWGAVKPSSWRYHPIDIRASLPLFGNRLFFVAVGGIERRSGNRRRRDARLRPFFTGSNVVFLAVMFLIAVGIGAVLSDVLDWFTNEFNVVAPVAHGLVDGK
ncbi:MAG TPA: hypothetical protein VGG27_13220 [Magnetospirillaceae bacterium]|jgi:hypothetical protein